MRIDLIESQPKLYFENGFIKELGLAKKRKCICFIDSEKAFDGINKKQRRALEHQDYNIDNKCNQGNNESRSTI